MLLTRSRKLAIAAAIALLGAFVVVQVGYKLGAEASEEAQQRMAVLWPSVRALPVEDRSVVVTAALTCRVQRLPADASAPEVAACLRAGALEHDRRHAGKQAPIAGRLEQLLRAAAGRVDKAPRPLPGVLT